MKRNYGKGLILVEESRQTVQQDAGVKERDLARKLVTRIESVRPGVIKDTCVMRETLFRRGGLVSKTVRRKVQQKGLLASESRRRGLVLESGHLKSLYKIN